MPPPTTSNPLSPAGAFGDDCRDPHEYVGALGLGKLPEMVAPAEVARLLNVSRQTVYVLVATGELAAIQVNRHAMRVFRRSLEDYLKRRAL